MKNADEFIEWVRGFEKLEKEREDGWYKDLAETIDKYLEHVKNQRTQIFKNL